MQTIKDIIIHLKQVRQERKLSLNDICDLVEKSGGDLSRSSIQRVFAEGSENSSFKYEETIRPIANALLDIEHLEETDSLDTQAMKLMLQYKIQRIEELEKQIEQSQINHDKEIIKYHEKREEERKKYNRSIDFLRDQVSLKDKRMDLLLDKVFEKDREHKELMNHIMNCPYRCETPEVSSTRQQ